VGTGGATGSGGAGGAEPCRALSFDGVATMVHVPDHADLDQFGNITIEAWIRPASYPSEVQILSHHDHGAHTGYVLLIFEGSQMQFRYQDGVDNHPVGYHDVPAGSWHHVAATYDGQFMRTFVDGMRRANADVGSLSAADYAGPLRIGLTSHNTNFPFHGIIDEVRLSKVARYAADFTVPTEPFTVDGDTVALWHFDEPSGQAVLDATGVHDGTLGDTSAVEGTDPARVEVPCIDERFP
jgi:hypothetical protein